MINNLIVPLKGFKTLLLAKAMFVDWSTSYVQRMECVKPLKKTVAKQKRVTKFEKNPFRF
ncbi:MAG: hypothetical protein ACKOE6_00815 [Flammeovirgaceae bacterium]